MAYPIDMSNPWYHGPPYELAFLKEGSIITQWGELADAFAAKPSVLEYDQMFSAISHNGSENGILYVVDEPIELDIDIYQHPRTTVDAGFEFLTQRSLKLKRAV